jgi:FkbH-like protein
MWQTEWADSQPYASEDQEPIASLLPIEAVESVYLLQWGEHCLECSVPECYTQCSLYVPRRDKKCARFKGGIRPNQKYSGLYSYGAEIHFRRWGKLESTLGYGAVTPAEARWFDAVNRAAIRLIEPISSVLSGINPTRSLNGAYAVGRERLLGGLTRCRSQVFDEFVLEFWNVTNDPATLIVEYHSASNGPVFRSSVLAEPGRTINSIPVKSMNVDLYSAGGLRLYPEKDSEVGIVFTWLDFVRYVRKPRVSVPEVRVAAPDGAESMVKCVIWDLDNTVWDGILGEQEAQAIVLRPLVRDTILTLDARGVLQSVASKNDYDEVWPILERLGISHLLLYPRINWRPKSINIREIIQELNLGPGACALIDDSAFERGEVASQLPEMRIYRDSDVANLLSRPEFQVRVTEESRHRRRSYAAELERKRLAQNYGTDYERFLRSCAMEARLFNVSEPAEIERSLELLHRSNQLNLSTHRYSREQILSLLGDEDSVCIATSCRDRFGDYGTIGFASLKRIQGQLYLIDFVMSCRVAAKQLENAWMKWLEVSALDVGYSRVLARYRRTARNGVLLNAFVNAGFKEIEVTPEGSLLELDCRKPPALSDIVTIDAVGVRALPSASVLGSRLVHTF